MESTFLLHKPVIYGSSFANSLFLTMLLLHIIAGAIAPVTAIVALTARKGGTLHVRFGRYFVWSILIVALTGIMLDVVRLCFFVKENHTKYAVGQASSSQSRVTIHRPAPIWTISRVRFRQRFCSSLLAERRSFSSQPI